MKIWVWTTALFSLLSLVPVSAQETQIAKPAKTTVKISSRELQADIEILVEALNELHPGLYRYNSPDELAASLDALKTSFSEDASLGQAYLELSKFCSTLKCGHTYCNFFNQPKAISEALFVNIDRVPFHFRWIDQRMIVTENRSNQSQLKPGTEVVSINGTDAQTILSELLKIARADGNNIGKRKNYLEIHGADRYEAFDIYLPLLFRQMRSPYTLSIREGNQEPVNVVVDSLPYAQRIEKRVVTKPEPDQPVWQWKQLNSKTEYLVMPTWALYNSKWNWQDWLNEKLDALVANGSPNLVIDLRGNEGGLDCGDLILERVIANDLTQVGNQRFVRYQTTPKSLDPYLDTWDDSFRILGKSAAVVPTPALVGVGKQPYFRLQEENENDVGRLLKAKAPRYAGRVFVIVDSGRSSATFQFAQVMKDQHLATIVGQTTGGNQRGINGGAFFFLRLPNSKIEIDIPLIARFGEPDAPDGGIDPDIVTQSTPESIANQIDLELIAIDKEIAKSS